jgi:hypothetical protein
MNRPYRPQRPDQPHQAPRPRQRRVAATLAAAAIVVALTLPSPAGAHGPDPVLGNSWFDQDQALTFDWRTGSVPPAALRTAIRAAASDASTSRRSRAATIAYVDGGANPIGYGPGNTCGPNGIACFQRFPPAGFTMWFREQGYRFDWGSLRWCQMYASPPNGCFDVETIALDEFGHVEGLGHHVNYSDARDYDDAVVQTVSRAKPDPGWNTHAFGRCDVATLQREYDVSTTSVKLSTCLDLDTVVTLAASPSSIAYGATTTLTATLKTANLTSYDRLKSQALSGRVVTLQRRPAGTASWTTVGAMTPGSGGTYRTTVTLRTATEFRTFFATPADEGVNGDTSPTIQVVVGACTIPPCPVDPGPV